MLFDTTMHQVLSSHTSIKSMHSFGT